MNEGTSVNNVSENNTEASHSNLNGGVEDLSSKFCLYVNKFVIKSFYLLMMLIILR